MEREIEELREQLAKTNEGLKWVRGYLHEEWERQFVAEPEGGPDTEAPTAPVGDLCFACARLGLENKRLRVQARQALAEAVLREEHLEDAIIERERMREKLQEQLARAVPLQEIVPRSATGSCAECARLTAEGFLREERLEEARTELVAALEENEKLQEECQEVAIERDQLRVQCKSLAEEKERLQGEVSQLGFYRKRYLDTYAELTTSRESLYRMRIQRDELQRVLRGRR